MVYVCVCVCVCVCAFLRMGIGILAFMEDVFEIWFELRSKCPNEFQPIVAKMAE